MAKNYEKVKRWHRKKNIIIILILIFGIQSLGTALFYSTIVSKIKLEAEIINLDKDKFGIKKIYPTAINGRSWYSKWDNGHTRSWTDQSNDQYDSEFITKYKGAGSYKTDGKGILKISGEYPRMYVEDPNKIKKWRNVEITIYGKRVSDDNNPSGGIMVYARTNHMIDSNLCDTRGYGGRFKYNGYMNFEKETRHGSGYAQKADRYYWPGGMPKNTWFGLKFIIRDRSDGNVKLELWIDEKNGYNGGAWNKVGEFVDNGSNFGIGEPSCKTNIDPAVKLTNSDNRIGSESKKPNLAIYFRSDGVNTDGLWYKKSSIREIT